MCPQTVTSGGIFNLLVLLQQLSCAVSLLPCRMGRWREQTFTGAPASVTAAWMATSFPTRPSCPAKARACGKEMLPNAYVSSTAKWLHRSPNNSHSTPQAAMWGTWYCVIAVKLLRKLKLESAFPEGDAFLLAVYWFSS
jgi:hypothetical protein